MTGIIFVLLLSGLWRGGRWKRSGNGHLRRIRPILQIVENWFGKTGYRTTTICWVRGADYRCKSADSFSENQSRITNLFVPNGDKLFRRTFLLEAKTHEERATFNNASRTIESPTLMSFKHYRCCTRENSKSWSITSSKSNLEKSDMQLTLYPESILKLTVILRVDIPLGLGLNCDVSL